MHRHTAGSRASAKFLHRPARSLRRTISLLSTFGAVAGVQLQTSRSIKPRERDLGDLRLFFLARFLTRPTNHPRHAACASNFKSKPVRPRNFEDNNIADRSDFAKVEAHRTTARIAKRLPRPTNRLTPKALFQEGGHFRAWRMRHRWSEALICWFWALFFRMIQCR